MSITLNTYGIRSINSESFNTYGSENAYLPRGIRDLANTLLRINNLVLNILGYIPGVAHVSGSIRMGIGCCICVITLALGSPNAERGLIIGRWYKEALLTGIAQIARGALEAFVPYGRQVNIGLDIAGTVVNLANESSHIQCGGGPGYEFEEGNERADLPPYRDPAYPLPLFPLYFA